MTAPTTGRTLALFNSLPFRVIFLGVVPNLELPMFSRLFHRLSARTPGSSQAAALRATVIALFAATLCAFAFSACAFKKDDEAAAAPKKEENVVETIKNEKAKEAANGVLTAENCKIEFAENPDPNSYRMIVSWPKSITNVSIRINGGPVVLKNNVSSAEFPVRGDEDQSVELVAYGSISAAPLSSIVLPVARSPKDLVISSLVSMPKPLTLEGRRLYFMSGGKIQTNGFPLTIAVTKLYVSSSRASGVPFTGYANIVTFAEGTIAADPSQLAGGNVFIHAVEAHGDLSIAMIGANGRTGATGAEVEAKLLASERPSRTPAPPQPKDKGKNGTSVRASGVRSTKPEYDTYAPSSCTSQPLSGAPGPEGRKGITGSPGEKGGNPGSLSINIGDVRDLRIDVRQKLGKPGDGGPGGPGFPGGLGGLPGDAPEPCHSDAVQGEQGATGGVGDKGKSGDSADPLTTPGSTLFKVGTLDP